MCNSEKQAGTQCRQKHLDLHILLNVFECKNILMNQKNFEVLSDPVSATSAVSVGKQTNLVAVSKFSFQMFNLMT